jgi:hypothetical protein
LLVIRGALDDADLLAWLTSRGLDLAMYLVQLLREVINGRVLQAR